MKNPDTGVVEPTVMTVTADKFRVLLSGTFLTQALHESDSSQGSDYIAIFLSLISGSQEQNFKI